MKKLLSLFLFGMLMIGCSEKPVKPPKVPVILVTESHRELVQKVMDEGVRLEKNPRATILGALTREAIVAMLNDSVKTICVDRQLNAEEMSVAIEAEKKVTENVLAYDALVIIVHETNSLKELSMEHLRKIIHGEFRMWSDIPGTRRADQIDLVLTGRNSGSYELLQRHFFPTKKDLALTSLVKSHQEAVDYVASHPQSIGIVSLPAIAGDRTGYKLVAMETTNKEYEKKFVLPSQRDVYLALYPLRYSLYLYTTEQRPDEGSAFVTFALKLAGQKVVQNSGLVPKEIPSRSIQLTAESY